MTIKPQLPSLLQWGGETIFLQPTLGTGDLRQMGTSNGVFRLPVRVHQSPTRTPQGDLHTASQGQRQAQGAAARSQPAPPHERGREGHTRADSFPLSLLPYNEEIGRLATYPQPQETQQIHQATSVQDGVVLSAVFPELQHNWWGASLDLKDAYLHIATHPSSRKWLGFAIGEENFRFRSLPFGLSTAPRTFTRIVKVIAEHLRRQGMYVFIYLDDWLLTAPSLEILRDQVHMVSDLVQRLGFIVNFQKSTLQPFQKVQFPGSHLDFTKRMGFPTEERVQSVIHCASQLLREATPPARLWMRMLGLIASPKYMLPQSILRMRVIQLHVLGRFRIHKDSLSRRISKTTKASNALLWWTQLSNVRRGKRFALLPPASTLTTDASRAGWGAHWGDIQLSGTWSSSLAKKHINLLDLWAIHLALRRLRHYLRGTTVLVKCDNMSVVMYINKRGGVRSRSLCLQTILLLKWCTGGGKQVGRCTVKESVVNSGQAENPGVVIGVAPESDRVSNAVQPPAKTSHRPICQQSQQALSNLLQLGCWSDGVRWGCNGNQQGHDNGLRLPFDCSHPQSAGEDRQLQVVRHDPDSSKVASAAVVPETPLSPCRRSSSDPQGPHPDRRRSPSP